MRRILGERRVGHAGTLDPFATGLLLLLVGRATRLVEYASALPKTYLAHVRLGAISTTDDREGAVSEVPGPVPGEPEVRRALEGFLGEQDQVPPAFSAKRVSGERAYRLARRDVAVPLAPVCVRVDEIRLLAYDPPGLVLRVRTGPGLYVRALARDLGRALGSAAYLTELRREAVGPFRVEDAVDVGRCAAAELAARLLPADAAVGHLPVVSVDAEGARALAHGRTAVAAGGASGAGPREGAGPLRLVGPGGFLGVGTRNDGGVRPLKVLFPERA